MSLMTVGISRAGAKQYLVVLAAVFLGSALHASELPVPKTTPKVIGLIIKKHGAPQAIKILTNAHRGGREFGDYYIVLSGVSSGDRRWLALVPRLKAGTDAATSLALIVSVAEALPRNPMAVLSLIKANPSWQNVCTYPMIEPTKAEQRIYFRKAIPAVRSVRDPTLRSTTNRCLANLVQAQHAPKFRTH